MQLRTLAAAIGAAGLLAALSLPAAAAVDDGAAPVATISVTGQGRVSRPPDSASVAVSIVTNDDDAARALSANNARFAALGAKLGAVGIAAGSIRSTSIQSYFNARPTGENTPAPGQLYGFVVTRNAEIDVTALAQTGAVVDAATAAGATQINGVTYGFRDRRAVERAALAAAVADAYAQAQVIAEAAHVQIVRVLHVGNDASPGRIAPLAMTMAKSMEAPVPTSITPSDLEVTSSVSVTYVIR